MAINFSGEKWKPVEIKIEHSNTNRLEVSNFGRVRSFNASSNGNILEGSMINGYKIIRCKFYAKRTEEESKKLMQHQNTMLKFEKKVNQMEIYGESNADIKEARIHLRSLRETQKQKVAEDLKNRATNFHWLIHRLVATTFLKTPTLDQTIVSHLNYDKLNNRVSNLKWMTKAENLAHQKESPNVIAELENRRETSRKNGGITKLTVTKVMLLKKLLNEGKSIKALVKQFKVTDTQILRIKRGENWGDISAAK